MNPKYRSNVCDELLGAKVRYAKSVQYTLEFENLIWKRESIKKKKKGTTNITLDDEKIAALPLRLGKRHLLSNIAPEVLASAAEQEKGKRHTD